MKKKMATGLLLLPSSRPPSAEVLDLASLPSEILERIVIYTVSNKSHASLMCTCRAFRNVYKDINNENNLHHPIDVVCGSLLRKKIRVTLSVLEKSFLSRDKRHLWPRMLIKLLNQGWHTSDFSLKLGLQLSDVELVCAALAAGANVGDELLRQELLSSASHGRMEMLEVLIRAGVDVNLNDGYALLLAAAGGQVGSLALLLGANPVIIETPRGKQAIEQAASGGHVDALVMLLNAGAGALNQYNALYRACCKGHVAVVKLLLAVGAHRVQEEYVGSSILTAAAVGGHGEVVDILLKTGAVDVRAHEDQALRRVCTTGRSEMVRVLLAAGADVNARGGDPLVCACNSGAVEVVNILVKAGADVNAQDDRALRRACTWGLCDVVNALIAAGADVNAPGGVDPSPLSCASNNGAVEVVNLLIKAGADVHAQDDRALKYACTAGHSKVVRALLAAGADVNARGDVDHPSPLACAAMCDEEDPSLVVVKILLEANAEVRTGDDVALVTACTTGWPKVVKALLAAEADVNARGGDPLACASHGDSVEVVEVLLQAGADVHARDDEALQNACDNRNSSIARALIGADANVNARGGKMVRYAYQNGNLGVIYELVKAGAVFSTDDIGAEAHRALMNVISSQRDD